MSSDQLIGRASRLPYGPCFVSVGWRDENPPYPVLLTVAITRRTPAGLLIPSISLVDRACMGIRNSLVTGPLPEDEFDAWIALFALMHGGMEECDPLVAQSILYHAIDYARGLGFEPHPDFVEPLVGPRPDPLLDTPFAKPARPVYVVGMDEDMQQVLDHLDRTIGEDNYDFIAPLDLAFLDEEDMLFTEAEPLSPEQPQPTTPPPTNPALGPPEPQASAPPPGTAPDPPPDPHEQLYPSPLPRPGKGAVGG